MADTIDTNMGNQCPRRKSSLQVVKSTGRKDEQKLAGDHVVLRCLWVASLLKPHSDIVLADSFREGLLIILEDVLSCSLDYACKMSRASSTLE